MSCIYKVYFNQHTEDGNVEKSLLGELLTPTISSFADILKLLEPNLGLTKSSKSDIKFLELSIVFRNVDPDFTDFPKED